MAAKSKKRLSRNENKLLKLEKLQINDVLCSICQSILIEPVTLPCYHDFCHGCFNGSVENNALCCPLCRLRIGSWLRTTKKQNNLVNIQLWNFIKSKFSKEIDIKLKGDDIDLPEEKPLLRLSAPGEIRSEYEAELKRLRAERQQLEQKHLKETELLVKKIQEEEEEAHKRYLERLKQDEILAQKIHQSNSQDIGSTSTNLRQNIRNTAIKQRPKKTNKIDNYLLKQTSEVKHSPLLTDDNTSTDSSTPKAAPIKGNSRASPEMVPSYSRYLKSVMDKKNKNVSGLWNKENGQGASEVISTDNDTAIKQEDDAKSKDKVTKTAIQSLPVSLPYTGILQHKKLHLDNRNLETGSADSMRQELCYFKPILPIEGTTPTSFKKGAGLPLKVPCKRKDLSTATSDPTLVAPSRSQYLDGLCRLRDLSLAQNLPSAFVIALNLLRVTKGSPTKCETKTKASLKQMPDSPIPTGIRRTAAQKKEITEIDGITKLAGEKTLRRTRSMGSIHKAVNETTPKKAKIKDRKVSSERKRYLRSDSKKTAKNSPHSPTLVADPMNNNKINLVTKKLSSPLENCDVKKILEEQLRIERMIEQEKNDLELARKMDAELNGRRRRSAVKRQVTLNGLRPAKKLKV